MQLSKFFIFIFFILNFFIFSSFSIFAFAYRSQGHTNTCFAFAEEQLLKDASCKENCKRNASNWKYSIFEIMKLHDHEAHKNEITKNHRDQLIRLFENGSFYSIPYNLLNNSLLASKCTLERDLFKLNQSKIFNPFQKNMPFDLFEIFEKIKTDQIKNVFDANIDQSIIEILEKIARSSTNEVEFAQNLISFKLCEDRLDLPQKKIMSTTPQTEDQISLVINRLIANKKSILASVCSEVLTDEISILSKCHRHAIVIKEVSSIRCRQGVCEKYFLVIDSGFSSNRAKNSDGSMWIPESVVVSAIFKAIKSLEETRSYIHNKISEFENSSASVKDKKKYLIKSEKALKILSSDALTWLD